MPRAVAAFLTKELKSLKWPVFNFSALHTNLYFANSIVSEPNGINTNILFGNSKIMLLFVCTLVRRPADGERARIHTAISTFGSLDFLPTVHGAKHCVKLQRMCISSGRHQIEILTPEFCIGRI